jgi:hypothetical protein
MSHVNSDYDPFMCTELLTQCPDCDTEITETSGDLGKFLDLIDKHLCLCPGGDEAR